jgi:hypothetical protein
LRARAFPPFFAAFVLTVEMRTSGTIAESFGAWPVRMSTSLKKPACSIPDSGPSIVRYIPCPGRAGLCSRSKIQEEREDGAMSVVDSGKRASAEQRYSPARCTGSRTVKITGNPDERHINTAFAERQNLTMRMSMRRFTRLTNAFSKKLDNHKAAVALYFMWYNFARIHQTLRVTPAMEAGISDHVWSAEEIARLVK